MTRNRSDIYQHSVSISYGDYTITGFKLYQLYSKTGEKLEDKGFDAYLKMDIRVTYQSKEDNAYYVAFYDGAKVSAEYPYEYKIGKNFSTYSNWGQPRVVE